MRRFPQLGFLLALLLVGLGAQSVLAQTAPDELGFKCGNVNPTTKAVSCELEVPADTIGSELNITIPTDKLSEVSDLQKGANLSATSIFFKLELSEQNGVALINIDFADINAEAFATSPYALVSIKLVLKSIDDLPLTIPAKLKRTSKLFNPAGLGQSQPSFSAAEDSPLPIVIGEGVAPSDITSSFTFEGGDLPPGLQGVAGLYCFDDPISSMTDAEWAIICDAMHKGIISGNPREDGTFFFPNQPINRAEAVKIVTLGILRMLGKLTDDDFAQVQRLIEEAFPTARFISYIDILYEADGAPPWFAVYVNIATDLLIVHGYLEDDTYRAINKINNAESYRIIVEAGRVASAAIAKTLAEATISTKRQEWFMKYSETLKRFNVAHSEEFAKFTKRKDFLIIVMSLLASVGL